MPESIYPDAIDGYAQLPLVVDTVTSVKATTVNRLRSAIVNIEGELGITPSGSFDTVRERLDAFDPDSASGFADLVAAVDVLETEVDTIGTDLDTLEDIVAGIEIPESSGGAPETFIYRPGGVASGNVYTDFNTLYTDLSAAEGYPILILDDEGTGSIAIPDGDFELTGCTITNGKVSSLSSVSNITYVTWGTATSLKNVSRWENLAFGTITSGLGTPILYTKDTSVTMVRTLFYLGKSNFNPSEPDPIIKSVPDGAQIDLIWEMEDSTFGFNSATDNGVPTPGNQLGTVTERPSISLSEGGDTIKFYLKQGSIFGSDNLFGGASDSVDFIHVDPGSSFYNDQSYFSGTLPEALPGGSAVVYDGGDYDDWGVFPAPGTVQDALTKVIADKHRTYDGSGSAPGISTIPIVADSANTLDIMVSAIDPVANDSASWFIRALAEDQGGVRAIVGSSGTGTPTFSTAGASGWTTTISMSGSYPRITGGSATADTVWMVKVTSVEAVE